MSKWMWIIAGPNGAGKSGFAGSFLKDLGDNALVKLNADERTLKLRKQFPREAQDDLNLKAAIAVDNDVEKCIDAGQSFVVETVLSSSKYRDDVIKAKTKGFKFGLIYISIYPPELSSLRVSERVAKGGHDVDPEKAIERHHKSHEQLCWFAPQADLFMVFDNSNCDGIPVLLASRKNGEPLKYIAQGVNPAVDFALANLI
jgi:predicted ABC-type ATPase